MKVLFAYILSFLLLGGGAPRKNLQEYLSKHLQGFDGFKFEIVHKAPQSFTIDQSRNFKREGKFGYVPVLVNSGIKKKTYLTVKLKLFKKCFVAKRKILKGEALSREMFDYMAKDVSGYIKTPEGSDFVFNGFQANKTIRAGEVLFREDVETIPVVKSGMPVKAEFVNGNVMIEMRAVARQDGRKNQVIKIKAANKRIYSAKVIDANHVLIME